MRHRLVFLNGLLDSFNTKELSKLKVDLLGFNFIKDSDNYIGETIPFQTNYDLKIKTVGSFKNCPLATISKIGFTNHLDYLLLTGNESPQYCELLRNRGYQIIKQILVNEKLNFNDLRKYYAHVDLFQFQTSGKDVIFHWKVLKKYQGPKSFLIGGLQPQNILSLRLIYHPYLAGVTIGQNFETEPGILNPKTMKTIVSEAKDTTTSILC